MTFATHQDRAKTSLRRGAGGWIRAAIVLMLLCTGVSRRAVAEEAGVSKEYQIKAAFLYNFTKFVEWPPERFAGAGEPIVIGVLGKNLFGDELNAIVRGRKVNGRALVVVPCHTIAEAAAVHVVFVAPDDEALLASLAAAQLSGVLTVSEGGARGTMVDFKTVGDKVRFEIDVAAAERAGLKVSAQLQKLATAVHRKN